MCVVTPAAIAEFLREHPPFDALDDDALRTVASEASEHLVDAGDVVADGFAEPADGLFVVVEGRVGLWNSKSAFGHDPQELLGAGGVFGFSAMLTQRPVGPRAVALAPSIIAFVPAPAVSTAFSSTSGARFLAEQLALSAGGPVRDSSYRLVDDLIVHEPVVGTPRTPVHDLAREMTARGVTYAAIRVPGAGFGLITDATLRERVLADSMPSDTQAGAIMLHPAPTTHIGESASTALISMLDQGVAMLLVLDESGEVRGAVTPSDFAVSGAGAEIALHQQLANAPTIDALTQRSQGLAPMVDDLLSRGLATSRVTAVYSAAVDAIVRRAIVLTFAAHPDLDVDAFTWLALGSTARSEAVLSSDIDSAVAFRRGLAAPEQSSYRTAFAEINSALEGAGLRIDPHGATAARAPFARTSGQWRTGARAWLTDPVANKGAIMTSLMVDARPIHGDRGLPDVTRVFGELRSHPSAMRLLLTESLSQRARLRSTRDVLARRGGTFDIKSHALVPVTNIARWAALIVGTPSLSTTDRLRDAAGGMMLPNDRADTLIEVFEVLQRVRLRYQLQQLERGTRPSDIVTMQRLSTIDRSTISRAVREIAANQRRMASIAQHVSLEEWFTQT